MKVKVVREIHTIRYYEDVVDYDPKKDSPYELDIDLNLKNEVIVDDFTYFNDPKTGEILDLTTEYDELTEYKK